MGMALVAYYMKVLAKGEMDSQCAEEFDAALANLFAEGMPKVNDLGVTIVDMSMVRKNVGGSCDIIAFMSESIDTMTSALRQWSAGAVDAELRSGTFTGVVNQITAGIAAYDQARLRSCVLELADMRALWGEVIVIADLKRDWADLASHLTPKRKPAREPEMDMKDFAFVALGFIDGPLKGLPVEGA